MKPKKNPQDATLRNIRALKKRVEMHAGWVESLDFDVEEAFERIRRIEEFLSFHGLKTPNRSKRK